MAARTCPNCNAKVRARMTFCVRCGYQFTAPSGGGRNDPLKVIAFIIMGAFLLAIVILTVMEHL